MTKFANRIMNELQASSTYDRLLLDDLRELLEEGVDEENTRWIHELVSQLCANLEREFALEQEGGYLTEVLERFPSWETRIQQARAERGRLLSELRAFVAELDDAPRDRHLTHALRDKFRAWVNRLSTHKQHENTLLLDAMNLDVGEGE